MKRAKNPSPSRLSKTTVLLLVGVQTLVFIFAPVRIFQQDQLADLSSAHAQAQAAGPVQTTSQATNLRDADVSLINLCGSGPIKHRCTLSDVSAACNADPKNCTSADQNALRIIAGCSANASILNTAPIVGGLFSGNGYYSFGCSDLQKQQADQAAETLSHIAACTGGLANLSPTCLFYGLTAGVIGIFTHLAVTFLSIAGGLFSWLVQHTVIEFSTLYGIMQSGVERAWSAFRDIANILIIGIFTFIAISIILGLKEFGQKKLIANVLIIAVLINFSLLFAKIIIDASNYSAYQIYNAAGLKKDVSAAGVSVASKGITASGGIADQFIDLMNVQSFGNSVSAVYTIASTDNIGTAFAHGFLVFAVLVGAGLVLFYGSFLLVSRVIIIIFLMVTASIAFASYLVPGWAKSHYGWKTWWESLLKSAVFAPMLMFFLWMTLTVGTELQKGVGKLGSFGDVAANPTSAQNINSLFVYCLILGMLFVSFKLSSLFASRISGFSLASLVPAIATGILGRGVGIAGRQLIGRPALNISEKLQERARNSKSAFAASMYDFGAQRFKGAAQRDFNLMRTPFGTAIQQAAGVKKLDTLAGKQVKGFEGSQKEYLKRVGEQSRRLELKPDDIKNIQAKGLDKALREDVDLAQRYAESEKSQKENAELMKILGRDKDTMTESFNKSIEGLKATVVSHRAELASTADGTPERAEATRRVSEAEDALSREDRRRTVELGEQTAKIKEAREVSQRASRMFTAATEDAHKAAVAAGDIPKEFKGAGDIAKDIVRNSFTATLFKASGLSAKSKESLANKAAKEAGKQKRQQRVKDDLGPALKDFAKEEAEELATARSTPTPSAPAGGAGAPGGSEETH